MPVIPAWLVTAFWQYGVPLIIAVLRKAGAISWAEALGAKAVVAVENAKTYPEYPETEGQKAAAERLPGTTNTNLTIGHPPLDDDFPPQARSGL